MAQEVTMPASTPEDLSSIFMTHMVAEQTWVLNVVIWLLYTSCGMCPTHTPRQKWINKHIGEKEKNYVFFSPRFQIVCNSFTNIYFNYLVCPKFRCVSWDCFCLIPKSWVFLCFSTDPHQCIEELLSLNTNLVMVSTSLSKGKWRAH